MGFQKSYFLSISCLIIATISLGASASSDNTLVINTSLNPPLSTPDHRGFADLIASEALRRAGLRLQQVKLPAERGLKNVNAGIDDGDMMRVKGLEKLYPNLIRIPEKIMDWEFNAFSYQSLDLHGKWMNLSPHSVSFIIGWKMLENNVPKAAEVRMVKTQQQLFSLLEKKRTEVVIYERWSGLKYLQENNMTDVKVLTPPFEVKEMYIYLNKKHEKLIPKIARALRAMKNDGTYQRIYDQTLAPLVKINQ